MKHLILAFGLLAFVSVTAPAAQAAEIVKVPVNGSVAEAMNRLVTAVEGAGAMVFARVDHAGGAEMVGESLRPMELLIFGNPKIGTPAIQDSALAGLVLPLRVLAYEDADGAVFLAYEDPASMLGNVGGSADAPYLGVMAGALNKLTAAAAGN